MSFETGLEHLKKALEFEHEGFAFYRKALEEAEHTAAKSVFQWLVEEEREHAEYLLKLHGRLSADGRWPTEITLSMDKDFEMIFRDASRKRDAILPPSAGEVEALRFALAMEKKGREMYRRLREKAEDPNERVLYSHLAEWEQSHADLVERTLATLGGR
ncbi:MAG: ferritin family protein [Planctomycetota bacterium]|jgi:rubrerythrin